MSIDIICRDVGCCVIDKIAQLLAKIFKSFMFTVSMVLNIVNFINEFDGTFY